MRDTEPYLILENIFWFFNLYNLSEGSKKGSFKTFREVKGNAKTQNVLYSTKNGYVSRLGNHFGSLKNISEERTTSEQFFLECTSGKLVKITALRTAYRYGVFITFHQGQRHREKGETAL